MKRALHVLPTLEPRRRALETCVYCPKLCRSACPVSNAEPRETIIPWGTMSTAYFAARGDVALNESFAAPAWACTGCLACRESCDHRNDVTGTLLDVRDALVSNGLGPRAAKETIARFGEHTERARRAHARLGRRDVRARRILVGCLYARKLPDVARDAVTVAEKILGAVEVEQECCGLPLKLAGDSKAFTAHVAKFASQEMIVVDPGCASALQGAGVRVKVLASEVAARVNELRGGDGEHDLRWHDPCQLGRGLGIYDAPRAILTRVLGHAPLEFDMRRERAECSGGGGLLPLVMPENSRIIAKKRTSDHEAAGGGEIVTACAASVMRFRAAGAKASDLMTWVARAL